MDVHLLKFDGGSRGNPGPSGAGFVLYNCADDEEVQRGNAFLGRTTSNVAEYTALIGGLRAALSLGVRRLKVRGDSQLVINQVFGTWQVRTPHLGPLVTEARTLTRQFQDVDGAWIRRKLNPLADKLATMAMNGEIVPAQDASWWQRS